MDDKSETLLLAIGSLLLGAVALTASIAGIPYLNYACCIASPVAAIASIALAAICITRSKDELERLLSFASIPMALMALLIFIFFLAVAVLFITILILTFLMV